MASFVQVESDSHAADQHTIWYGFTSSFTGSMVGTWRISRTSDVGNNNSGYAYLAQNCDRQPPMAPRDHGPAGGWECDVLGHAPPPSLTWHVSAGDAERNAGQGQAPHPEPEAVHGTGATDDDCAHPEPEAADCSSDDDYVCAHDDGKPATVTSD